MHQMLDTAPVAAVAAVALGPWIAAGIGFPPFLLLLLVACPLGMMFMMRSMHGREDEPNPKQGSDTSDASEDGGQRLAELKRELSNLQKQQEAIAHDLAQVEGEQRASGNGAGGRTARPTDSGGSGE